VAAAALISLYVYLNFQQGPGDLPADEVALTFATVAIHSCAEAANAAQINKQIQQLVEADVQEKGAESVWQQQQQQQFGCAQVCCLRFGLSVRGPWNQLSFQLALPLLCLQSLYIHVSA
jgi:hypothetical protein